MRPWVLSVAAAVAVCLALAGSRTTAEADAVDRSPCAVAAAPDGRTLFVAEQTADRVALVDLAAGQVTAEVALPGAPTGLSLNADGTRLYVTCGGAEGKVAVIDTRRGAIERALDVGHTPTGLALAPDESVAYVCNRFDNHVGVVDLRSGRTTARLPMIREPVAAVLTPDGQRLVVANHLPFGRADVDDVAAEISLFSTAERRSLATVRLPSGCSSVRGLALSPDGRYAFATHLLGRFHLPTTQLERGWMNTNALSVIDVAEAKLVGTVLLDDVDRGAANPWGIAFTPDGASLVVAHSGSHEVSLIDVPKLLAKMAAAQSLDDLTTNLAFMVDLRRRIPVPGLGPRGLALVGDTVCTADYLSDTVSRVHLTSRPEPQRISLGGPAEPSIVRRGERLFDDATLCFQGWQSCSSCHPDGRADGFNWDLLNDGLGNPKNVKSMLLAHATPPAMSSGIRDNAEAAVRAGIRFILFAVRPEPEAVAIDSYLRSLTPVPSPHLVRGQLSDSARRGKLLFGATRAGCEFCHNGPYDTSLKHYNVGTRGELDERDDFDTPTLVEAWRTAPYLHDGRAATMMDVLTTCNPDDKHGHTAKLSRQELADLCEYVLSL